MNMSEGIDAVCNLWNATVEAAKPYIDKAAELAEMQLKEVVKVFSIFSKN